MSIPHLISLGLVLLCAILPLSALLHREVILGLLLLLGLLEAGKGVEGGGPATEQLRAWLGRLVSLSVWPFHAAIRLAGTICLVPLIARVVLSFAFIVNSGVAEQNDNALDVDQVLRSMEAKEVIGYDRMMGLYDFAVNSKDKMLIAELVKLRPSFFVTYLESRNVKTGDAPLIAEILIGLPWFDRPSLSEQPEEEGAIFRVASRFYDSLYPEEKPAQLPSWRGFSVQDRKIWIGDIIVKLKSAHSLSNADKILITELSNIINDKKPSGSDAPKKAEYDKMNQQTKPFVNIGIHVSWIVFLCVVFLIVARKRYVDRNKIGGQ